MFDIRLIRDDPDTFDRSLQTRGVSPIAKHIIEIDEKRRKHVSQLQKAQTQRNEASKEIGQAKASGDEARATTLIAEIAESKKLIQNAEEEERILNEELKLVLSEIPNIPLEDVPVGEDENSNVESHKWGTRPEFDFEPKEHFDLGELHRCMDFETAGNISGSRFVVLKGRFAKLERALGQFMIDLQTEKNGYEEISPPLLVRDNAVFGTNQLPKFAEDLFKTTNDLWLIPTAEVPLTNLVNDQIVDINQLPMRVTALTYCFRSEAGSAGRDVRGMLRQHQFSKCELVSITKPNESLAELERMRECAEMVLKELNIHYRVVILSTGDMGFGARKTYDLEVWLPGANTYREISSCSICGDFQARRMNARYRDENGKTQFVHTLNGSGIAVGRALIAVLENFQNEDGSITIPKVLQPYMGGLDLIEITKN